MAFIKMSKNRKLNKKAVTPQKKLDTIEEINETKQEVNETKQEEGGFEAYMRVVKEQEEIQRR